MLYSFNTTSVYVGVTSTPSTATKTAGQVSGSFMGTGSCTGFPFAIKIWQSSNSYPSGSSMSSKR